MDRRTLIAAGIVTLGTAAVARAQTRPANDVATVAPPPSAADPAPRSAPAAGSNTTGVPPKTETFSRDEIVDGVSDFLGVTAEAAGGAVERIFANNGRPTGYIAGEEGSGAIVLGGRYGRGLLYMKDREPVEVFWQGPSVGWDFGGNASRVFTLCYNLDDPETIFQRFPGVEGVAYLIGGLGVNYQKAAGVTLAPIRAGVGLRLGANVGYLSYTKKRNRLPF
ncbi:DUF1134 domain-containing protein [Phenylobacterium sp.]|uniref:DUF1134 domain-containing protein n=1 Tax=Phenylobacterium sp. TaxID=1871053 RepID=UPI0039832731